jgi:SAM-dependent methyltransferase
MPRRMNLVDLWKRKDRALLAPPPAIEPCLHRTADVAMHALRLPANTTLRIGELLSFTEMRVPPRWNGWAATVDAGTSGTATLRLAVDLGPGSRTEEVASLGLRAADADRWLAIRCAWPAFAGDAADANLLVEVTGQENDSVVLGIGEAVDLRAPLLALAKGRGIEIGPGMSPQVVPTPEVEVRYLEQYPVEQWARLYPKQDLNAVPERVRALWTNYITGNAQRLEVIEDGGLDFVFSSHVFEHLVNPLGTLEAWKRKLRPGGRILGVTPDTYNCFDLRQPLSTPLEWLAEHERGTWSLEDRHYERWVRYTEPRVTVQSLKDRGYSVHVHFYTPVTFAQLLDLAVQRLGFRRFDVRSTPNNKDFTWALYT